MNKESERQRPWRPSNGVRAARGLAALEESEWGDRVQISGELQEALRKFRRVIRTGCWTINKCGPSMYRTCEAFRKGLSCFDLPSTPCCDVNRKRCISCPTFIQIVELPKNKQPVIIHTDRLRVEGFLHCPVGMRIIDALNIEDRDFLAVTDAKIESLNAEVMEPYQVPFLALNRSQITMLTPRPADDGDDDPTPPPGDPEPETAGCEPEG